MSRLIYPVTSTATGAMTLRAMGAHAPDARAAGPCMLFLVSQGRGPVYGGDGDCGAVGVIAFAEGRQTSGPPGELLRKELP